jgi:catechol-2,3-dioxygenase
MSTRPRWKRPESSVDAVAAGAARPTALTLPCLHFDTTCNFYAQVLGLQESSRSAGRVALQLASIELVLVDASRREGFARGDGQGLYLEVAVPQLTPVRARLQALGAQVFSNRRTAGRLLTTQDPEGNLVNVVALPAGG